MAPSRKLRLPGSARCRRTAAWIAIAAVAASIAVPRASFAACAPVPADILHWWPGEGTADDIASGNDGTVTAPATFASGLVGQAFDFTAGGKVQMPFVSTQNITTAGFTAEFWLKSAPVAGDHALVDKSHGGGSDSTGWAMQATAGLIGVCVGGGAFPGDFACADSGMATALDGTFHHVAFTWSDTDDTVRFYVDGAETGTAIQDVPANNTRDLLFGQWWFGGRQYNGILDEVSLYGRALAPSEIAAIAAAGADGKCELCGDGAVEPLETCDPAAAGGECCNPTCDGYLADGAPCDDGDACTSGDECQAGVCEYTTLACCGDGTVQPVEHCDPAAPGGECCLPGCDGYAADGSACDDGDACTGPDTCEATACISEPLDCDDDDPCTQDSCSGGCVNDESPLPESSCVLGVKNSFSIKDAAGSDKDQLKWKLGGGEAIAQVDLGDPASAEVYTLCVYDRSGGIPSLATSLTVPAGAPWLSNDPKGFLYNDKTSAADGVKKLSLKTGAAGKSSLQLQAKGSALPTPAPAGPALVFDQDPSVTVQLVGSSGFCASTTFGPADTKKNDGKDFQAKTQ